MFGSLKKRLKEAVEKVSHVVSKEAPSELPKHDDVHVEQEIRKEAELITKDEPFEDLAREEVKEEKKEELEKVLEKVIEETEQKTFLEAEEEAKILAEQEPFSEVIEDDREREKKIEESIERKIEQLEEEDVAEARQLERMEEEVRKLGTELKEHEAEEALDELEKIEERTARKLENVETVPVRMEDDVNIEMKHREGSDRIKIREKIESKEERKIPQADIHVKLKTDDEEDEVVIREKVIEKTDFEKLVEEIKPAKTEEQPRSGLLRKITEKKLTESDINEILKELEMALLENDVSVEVTEKIASDLRNQLLGVSVRRGKMEDAIKSALKNSILNVLRQETMDVEGLIESKEGPFTIMMVGFNGVGKTTTLAKLAFKLRKYNPVLAAADTFRAASIEQLEEHGKNLNMRVIKHTYGADAAAVIFDAKKHALANDCKLVLADTAGRSHSNVNLMDELKKVARVNRPDLKVLVLDSITGNDIYDQCKLFNDAVGVDAIILTKADVYERGGAALSAAYTLKKPILYLGTGQEYKDLREFRPEEIANMLLE